MGGAPEKQPIERIMAAAESGDGTELKVSVSVDGREKRTEQKDWCRPRMWKPDETKKE